MQYLDDPQVLGAVNDIQGLTTGLSSNIWQKIVLIDNSQLGMVRQWQELFFEENFSEIDLSDNPDFSEVAHAFGIEAFTIDHRAQVAGAIEGSERLPVTRVSPLRITPSER